jgi:AraC-like DNA-binding protein
MQNQELIQVRSSGVFQEGYIPSDIRLILKLQDLIEVHFKEQRDPGFYADALSVTLKMLNPLCKAYLDKTVAGLVLDRVLKEAKNLLRYSRMSSREIAYELGFPDPHYFSRFFLRETGKRPKVYRRGE